MIGVILIQRTSSDGLSGLSGGGGGNALFSVRGKANILTKLTTFLAIGFLITSLTLAYLAAHKPKDSVVDKIAAEKTAPAPLKLSPADKAELEGKTKQVTPVTAPSVGMNKNAPDYAKPIKPADSAPEVPLAK